MQKKLAGMLILLPLATVLLLGLLLPGDVQGAAVVVTEEDITYTPHEPYHSDGLNVTVEPLFVQAEPVEDGVVLMWSLCTDEGCGIATPAVMTDNGGGIWSYEFDSFPEENNEGLPYKDVLISVEITYVPDGGGEEATVKTDAIQVDFIQPVPDDDDDDTTADDDDGDDSPFGLEILLVGVLITGAIALYRRRN